MVEIVPVMALSEETARDVSVDTEAVVKAPRLSWAFAKFDAVSVWALDTARRFALVVTMLPESAASAVDARVVSVVMLV